MVKMACRERDMLTDWASVHREVDATRGKAGRRGSARSTNLEIE